MIDWVVQPAAVADEHVVAWMLVVAAYSDAEKWVYFVLSGVCYC